MLLAGTGAAAATTQDETVDYLAEVRSSLAVPGTAVAVLEDGELLLEDVEGADGDGRPLTRDTPFVIGSVAKSMTAALVLQRVEAGDIDLDDPIGDHLPWLEQGEPTVEQLLTHTSGYATTDGLAVSERSDDEPGAVRRAAQDLSYSGTRGQYAYSSANYLVLGSLVEALAGRPFGEVLRSDLLEPLGMDRTSGLAEGGASLPPGHQWWFGRPRSHEVGTDESGAPYGYVVSTLADLETYAAAQAGGRPDLLDPAMLEMLHRPRVRSSDDHYGFGWRISGEGEEQLVHHTGATPGFFAHVMVRPADGRSVVVLADAYGEDRAAALASIAEDVLTIGDGGRATPGGVDPFLGGAPWVLVALGLAGLVAAVAAWRAARRRWVTAGGVALLVVALALVPTLLGTSVPTLMTWAPDVALSLATAVAAWVTVGLLLLVPRRRPPGVSAPGR